MKRIVTALLLATVFLSCGFLQGCCLLLNRNNELFDEKQEKTLSAEEIYASAAPSVVEITGTTRSGTTTGTGFFCDNMGTVITNYHVIEDCIFAQITLSDGTNCRVDFVLGYSQERDIAILSTACKNTTPLTIRTTPIRTGETVYAIGSSLGLSGSLSNGIVSSAARDVEGQTYIQTTAPISPGNSGGPLLDSSGHVVGITTASFVEGQNLNLAVPVSAIDSISTDAKIALTDLFPQKVEWLSGYDFFYAADFNKYALLFELKDKDNNTMSCKGKVDIKIINSEGVTVYEKTHSFTPTNFMTWIYDNDEQYYCATIFIAPAFIASSPTKDGFVLFTVYIDEARFEAITVTAEDLPVRQ